VIPKIDIKQISRILLLNKMATISEKQALCKRERIQIQFWNQVGSAEHISLPKLEDAIRKEFNYSDNRLVQSQIRLMQTEAKIRVQSNVKVWIKQPKQT
jgi:hypothetical protein